MKILFLDAYYEPETIAYSHLEKDLIEGLIEEGHKIHIICPVPTRGISDEIRDSYREIKHETKYNGNVTVDRFWAPQEGRNPLIRALRYFWCNIRTYSIGIKMDKVDAVFANSTPPTQGWIAGKVAKKLKVPFIYSLQDVFPDSLIVTGLTKENSFFWKAGRKLENATYNLCSQVIVISQSMKRNLLHKGVNEDLICVISNWVDLASIKRIQKKDNRLFDEFDISRKKFIVLYAGNFGAAQGAEIVIDTAELLQNSSDIQFVIFGGGAGFSSAFERAKKLPNVFVHPLLPQNRVPEVYSMGDVALIACRSGTGNAGMPSKVWSIMACNIPLIASFDTDSELSELINEAHAGICVEPENSSALAAAILEMESKRENVVFSREYVNQNASKETCVKKYIETINKANWRNK